MSLSSNTVLMNWLIFLVVAQNCIVQGISEVFWFCLCSVFEYNTLKIVTLFWEIVCFKFLPNWMMKHICSATLKVSLGFLKTFLIPLSFWEKRFTNYDFNLKNILFCKWNTMFGTSVLVYDFFSQFVSNSPLILDDYIVKNSVYCNNNALYVSVMSVWQSKTDSVKSKSWFTLKSLKNLMLNWIPSSLSFLALFAFLAKYHLN